MSSSSISLKTLTDLTVLGQTVPFVCFLQATEENMENEAKAEESENDLNPKAGENVKDDSIHEDMVAESAAVSQKDDAKDDVEERESKEGTSPNVSGSSDMVSGTPQKSTSRRQSFITLEKYGDGKSTSPGVTSTFTGPHTKITSSQKKQITNESNSPEESQGLTESKCEDFLSAGKRNSQRAVSQTPESPQRPKESLTKCEPVRLTDRMSTSPAEEDDVIPDTQTDVKAEEATHVAEEETSQTKVDDSQSSWSKNSPGELRRSGRHRVPPSLPGEDPEDRDSKYMQFKQKRSGDHLSSDSPSSDSPQSGPKTRSRQAAQEESSKHRLRSRSQRDQATSSQTPSQGRATKKIKLYSKSEEFLEKIDRPESRRRSRDSSRAGSQSDKGNQSHGRHGRRSKGSPRSKEEGESSAEVSEYSQESSQDEVTSDAQAVSHVTAATQELRRATDDESSKEDSQTTARSPQDGKNNSQTVAPPSANQSDQIGGATHQLNDAEVKRMPGDTSEDCPGLGEDNQLHHSNIQAEAASVSADVSETQNTSSSQTTSSTVGVRTRRKKEAVPGQEGSLSTPESSQSQSVEESADFSQGRSRYSRRRSSQPLVGLESSESESTTPTESIHVPKKRGRKPRASLQSPPTVQSSENEGNNVGSTRDQSLPAEHERLDASQESHELQESEPIRESHSDVESASAVDGGEPALENTSIQEEKQIPKNPNTDGVSRESGTPELQPSEMCESLRNDADQTQTSSLDEVSAAAPPADGEGDQHQSLDPAPPADPSEAGHTAALVEHQMECLHGSAEPQDEGEMQENELVEASAESTTPGQETDEKQGIQTEERTVAEDPSDVFSPAAMPEPAIGGAAASPSKLKDLEALMGPDVNHSPSGRVRWSPSASPSTSILKKGQKRALEEEELPSPVMKVSDRSRDSSGAGSLMLMDGGRVFFPCSPGAYLLLIPSSSRRLQMTSTGAALVSEPAPPGNPETPPPLSQGYSCSQNGNKSFFFFNFSPEICCCAITLLVHIQSSTSQHQLKACWS